MAGVYEWWGSPVCSKHAMLAKLDMWELYPKEIYFEDKNKV